MTIDAISFNGVPRLTKAGNEYDKTRANKVAGTLVGGAAAAGIVYESKQILKNPELFNTVRENAQKMIEKMNIKEFKNIKMSAEDAIKGLKVGTGVMAGAAVAAGLAIGAIVDGIVNKHRKNQADKAEQV